MTDTIKVTRTRRTPAMKLKELDERINAKQAELETLESQRTALIVETKAAAADLLRQVESC